MPTKLPRITITLSPETKAILDRLAEASERPASGFISEMLDEAAPAIFEPLIEALTLAKQKKPGALDVLHRAMSKTHDQSGDLIDQIKEAKKKPRKPRGKNAKA